MSTKSSSKFWKKFGLGKKTSSTQVNRPASIQSQTISSPSTPKNEDNRSVKNKRFSGVFLQRRQSMNSIKRLCQLSNPPSSNEMESKTPGTHSTSPLPPLPPCQFALEYQNDQANHVESTTAPLNSDLDDSDNTFDVITYDDIPSDEQTKTDKQPTRLVKPKSIPSLKKTPSTTSSESPKHKSRLRPPAKIHGSITPSKSSCSSLQKEASSGSDAQDEKDRLIQQLQDALQTEQSINTVLQGQKEAITRDLDYFSLTVDELMEEKETLVQKYEEEKSKCQSKDQDLNELLEKLKSSTDNARERSKEVDRWKAEMETTKEEASLEQEKLKAVLKQKEEEIARLKSQVTDGKEEIKILSSRLDQLVQETMQQKLTSSKSPSAIETPSASPQLDAQQYIPNDELQHLHDTSQQPQPPTIKTTGSRIALQKRVHPASTTTMNSNNSLDNELLSLTKEKEKLQSDYSKIPLSGGGHTSRRRKEHLEEMLDEVDSQLSKVKQKIRRS